MAVDDVFGPADTPDHAGFPMRPDYCRGYPRMILVLLVARNLLEGQFVLVVGLLPGSWADSASPAAWQARARWYSRRPVGSLPTTRRVRPRPRRRGPRPGGPRRGCPDIRDRARPVRSPGRQVPGPGRHPLPRWPENRPGCCTPRHAFPAGRRAARPARRRSRRVRHSGLPVRGSAPGGSRARPTFASGPVARWNQASNRWNSSGPASSMRCRRTCKATPSTSSGRKVLHGRLALIEGLVQGAAMGQEPGQKEIAAARLRFGQPADDRLDGILLVKLAEHLARGRFAVDGLAIVGDGADRNRRR